MQSRADLASTLKDQREVSKRVCKTQQKKIMLLGDFDAGFENAVSEVSSSLPGGLVGEDVIADFKGRAKARDLKTWSAKKKAERLYQNHVNQGTQKERQAVALWQSHPTALDPELREVNQEREEYLKLFRSCI